MALKHEEAFDALDNPPGWSEIPRQETGISDGYGEALQLSETPDIREVLLDKYSAAKTELAKVGLRLTVECSPHVDITKHPDWMEANSRAQAADRDIFRFHEIMGN